MTEQDKVEEQQVEDLAVDEEAAEDVKGGFSWGATQVGAYLEADGSVRPGADRKGMETQHNETLVRI